MRTIIGFFLVLLNLFATAQDFPIKIDNKYFFLDTIHNQINHVGLKQGKWIEFEFGVLKKITVINDSGIDSFGNTVHESTYIQETDSSLDNVIYFMIGEYYNGLKNRTWIKYNNKLFVLAEYEYNLGNIIDFKMYYENGRMQMIGKLCKNRKIMEVTKYNVDGVIIENKKYPYNKMKSIFNK